MSEDDRVEQIRQKFTMGFYGDAPTADNIVTGDAVSVEDAIEFHYAAKPYIERARAEARFRVAIDSVPAARKTGRPTRARREHRAHRRSSAAAQHAARAPARPDRPRRLARRLADALRRIRRLISRAARPEQRP